jgi:LysM repeat protein
MPSRNSNLFVAVFAVITVHVIFLGVLLIQGCQREDTKNTGFESTAPNAQATAPADRSSVAVQQEPTPTSPQTAQLPQGGTTPSFTGAVSTLAPREVFPAKPQTDPTVLASAEKSRLEPGGASSPTPTPAVHQDAPAHSAVYVVKSGDNLTKIARNHGTTISAIRAANALKTDRIVVGQKLKLPDSTEASSTRQETSPVATPSPSTNP